MEQISRILDRVSDFLAHRKGLLPLIGILLISINFLLVLFTSNWFTQTNFFLHSGLIVAILGFLIAWAL